MAVFQAVLIFGSDTWFLTPLMVRTLGGVSAQSILPADRKSTAADPGRKLVIIPLRGSDVGGRDRGCEYVLRRQNTVMQYITEWNILDLYEETVRRPGTRISKRWW